ncbi:acyl-CoA thioesterase domain-containing protein [Dermatobacter hominis]|uniref:acyl-CoA thioesterase domain-containing protein n=1 Tax=Dermatobacter hominis TaxID=2884263 RepID=UPI001D123B7E|nr:acyl-CoA thioesterase domain-containing protein [Dermatobacter hominis]UDY34105.1 thioesterase family protein [Dermatobacter hominis]
MGDLGTDTALAPLGPAGEDGDGVRRFGLDLSDDWRIWTLNGGYVAAVALRAAGAATELPTPGAMSLQLVRGAVAGPAEVRVRSVRRTRTAECLAVELDQSGGRVAEGHVWAVDHGAGPEHDDAGERPADGPLTYPTIEERVASRTVEGPPPPDFPFWRNFETRPIDWIEDWNDRTAGPAVAGDWLRFVPVATFDDPFLDAGRVAVALDLYSFPSMTRAYAPPIEWIAPNVDLHCTFHRPSSGSEWILGRGHTPVAAAGTAGFTAEAWSEDGRLLASGGGKMLVRTVG